MEATNNLPGAGGDLWNLPQQGQARRKGRRGLMDGFGGGPPEGAVRDGIPPGTAAEQTQRSQSP